MSARPSPEFRSCTIRVETNYDMKKNTQSLIGLASLSSKYRIIHIPTTEVLDDDLAMQEKVQAMMIQHYQAHQGALPFWGKITCYRYFYSEPFMQTELVFSFNPITGETLFPDAVDKLLNFLHEPRNRLFNTTTDWSDNDNTDDR